MRIRTTTDDRHFTDDDASLYLRTHAKVPDRITTMLCDVPPLHRLGATTHTYDLPPLTLQHAARTPDYRVSEAPPEVPNHPLDEPACVAVYQYLDPEEPFNHRRHVLGVGGLGPASFFTIPESVVTHLGSSPPDSLLCYGYTLKLFRRDFLEKALHLQKRTDYLDYAWGRLRKCKQPSNNSVCVYPVGRRQHTVSFPYPLPRM